MPTAWARQNGVAGISRSQARSHKLISLQPLLAAQATNRLVIWVERDTTRRLDGWFHSYLGAGVPEPKTEEWHSGPWVARVYHDVDTARDFSGLRASWWAFLDHLLSCSNTGFCGVWFLVADSWTPVGSPAYPIVPFTPSLISPRLSLISGHPMLGEHAGGFRSCSRLRLAVPSGVALRLCQFCVDPSGVNGIRDRFQLPVKWLIQTQFPSKTAFAF